MDQFDSLQSFFDWYVTRPLSVPVCHGDGVTRIGAFSGLILYRHGRYQVQLWICDPNSIIPEHSHPHVDSIQVYLSGQVYLSLNNNVVIPEAEVKVVDGVSNAWGRILRVRPTDTHGAKIGPLGGAFMTFQEWQDRPPQSVELDWVGDPLSKEHSDQIGQAS